MRDPDVSENSYRQSLSEDVFICAVLVCSAHQRFFYENAQHKFTFDIDTDITGPTIAIKSVVNDSSPTYIVID